MTNTLKVASDLYVKPALNALGGARWSYRKITIGTADEITTQIIGANILPAGHRIMDAFVEMTALDTGASVAVSIGILNTYFGQAAATATVPAAYSSGGGTATDVDPQLVSGQNLFTTMTTLPQGGGRARFGTTTASTYTLTPSYSIGVDKTNDRIVAIQFTTAPQTAKAGYIMIGILIDRDQE